MNRLEAYMQKMIQATLEKNVWIDSHSYYNSKFCNRNFFDDLREQDEVAVTKNVSRKAKTPKKISKIVKKSTHEYCRKSLVKLTHKKRDQTSWTEKVYFQDGQVLHFTNQTIGKSRYNFFYKPSKLSQNLRARLVTIIPIWALIEQGPIQSVIIRVINKIRRPWSGSSICQSRVWLQTEQDDTKSCYQFIIIITISGKKKHLGQTPSVRKCLEQKIWNFPSFLFRVSGCCCGYCDQSCDWWI